MPKPETIHGYSPDVTETCERVLVTLLRGLGPWKKSVYLVGGLTPRYLVSARPPVVAPHAGTGDVDVVVELQMLAEIDAYHSLEANLKKMGFERGENTNREKVSWRWQVLVGRDKRVILEFLADDPKFSGGKVQPLLTEGSISALNIPHSSMVFDHYQTKEISAKLLGDNGIATETIRHADLVSFTCLKAFALDDRNEGKDAHDLIYCLEYATGGLDAAATMFRDARAGNHGAAVEKALAILKKRFADDGKTEGYRKDGPVAVANFEIPDTDDEEIRDARVLRRRRVSDLVNDLLARIG